MANVPINSIKFPGQDDTYTFLQNDTTLSTSGKAADAKITGGVVDSVRGIIAAERKLVNYGYYNQSVESTTNLVGVEKYGTQVIISGEADAYANYVRVSGSEIIRAASNSTVKAWEPNLTLTPGHTYRASLTHMSGTITNANSNWPVVFVLKENTTSSIGTMVTSGFNSVRTFTADNDALHLGIYIYKSTSFTNAVYQILLEDITNGIPDPPTTAGTYALTVTVDANGVPIYTWEA